MLCSLEEEGEVYNCSLHLDFIVLLSNYWTCRLVFPNNRKSNSSSLGAKGKDGMWRTRIKAYTAHKRSFLKKVTKNNIPSLQCPIAATAYSGKYVTDRDINLSNTSRFSVASNGSIAMHG